MSTTVNIAVDSGEKAFVWSTRDARLLREEHHICGILLGTLPQMAQQNVFLGLPLQLLPEEVVLLVKRGIATLVDDRQSHQPATEEQAKAFHDERTVHIAEERQRVQHALAEKRKAMLAQHEETIKRKREEKALSRLSKQQAQAQATASASASGSQNDQDLVALSQPPETTSSSEPPAQNASATSATSTTEDVTYSITIAGDSAGRSWYNPVTYNTLEAARAAGLWTYPNTPLQTAKCAVFEDLWHKGYFMGGGLRFGGDFLVYPGDSLRFHSHFSTTVFPHPLSQLRPIDLVSYGRLATGVKKAHLLCGYDPDTGNVDYYSLEWARMG